MKINQVLFYVNKFLVVLFLWASIVEHTHTQSSQ